MVCIQIEHGFICGPELYPLTLLDGRRVFMEWHNYLGPTFFKDRARNRIIDNWYSDHFINRSLEWFIKRGKKA